MAKGAGLDAGRYEVKVVELDGSYRKPRLTKVSIDAVSEEAAAASGEVVAEAEAEAALHALKDASVAKDSVNLGFPCREAVLRILDVPFVGADQIRRVLKFEVESSIHSHQVDEMVVDFHTIEKLDGETRVLVAAVPKKELGEQLRALEALGIEPERVDLDAMALFRAAEWAGCFGEEVAAAAAAQAEEGDDAEELADALPVTVGAGVPGQGVRARLVIDVGARSTRIVAVVNGRLVSLRAPRLGEDSIVDEVAERTGLGIATVRDAILHGVAGLEDDFVLDESFTAADSDDAEIESDESLPAPTEDAVAESAVVREPLTEELLDACRQRFVQRLRGEMMRFMTSLPAVAGVEQVWLTGGGSRLAGVREMLGDVYEAPVYDLNVLDRLQHNLDADEAREIAPRIATAVGLALGMLGAGAGFNFRQEELAYRRHFDRVKFPLAIALMLAVFLPFLYGMRQYKELGVLEKTYGALYRVTGSEEEGRRRGATRTTAEFWGYVGNLMQDNSKECVLRLLGNKEYSDLTKRLLDTETFDRLREIRLFLERHLKREQEKTGIFQSLALPSGVYVVSYFADVVKATEPQLGSFLVTDIRLNLTAQERTRKLEAKFAIRGQDYRRRYAELRQAFTNRFSDPNCPFEEFGEAPPEDVFGDASVPGAYYTMNLKIKPEFGAEVN